MIRALALSCVFLLAGCNVFYPDFAPDVEAMQKGRDLHENTTAIYRNTDSAIRQVVEGIEDEARKSYWTEKLDANLATVLQNDADIQTILETYQKLIETRGQEINWKELYDKLKNKVDSLR